ncbi:MAG: bile acid:Na+ symporter, family [Firmicutes bacterium]|nr:bile acid:Na+ symporter, family [Bacillota bacterium]
MEKLERAAQFITKLFPVWVIVFAAVAFFSPNPFKPFGTYIPYLLGLIMLGMGLTMSLDDFKLVFTRPIIAIITIVVALSAAKLATVAAIGFIAVAMHNGIGLGMGYGASRTLGLTHKKAKALAFEIGMENSGLAVALAVAHLDPIAAIPGAIFSVWHNFTGSLLAGYWGSKDSDEMISPNDVKA